jgi:hypothetical protein
MSKKSSSQLAWRSEVASSVRSRGGVTHRREDRSMRRITGIGQ